MKIDPNTLGLPQTNSTGAGRASSRNIEKLYGSGSGSASRSTSSTDASSGDAVQLSDLSAALRMLSPDSPERAARLEELSKLVASGEYKVDAQQLSRSLADEYFSPVDPATGQSGGEDA